MYKDEQNTILLPDWWNIPILNSQAKERISYPTQKPEELLERIIKASTREGDIVADFFCSIVAAEKLGCRWIGANINHMAISEVEKLRLKPLGANYELVGFPIDIAMAERLAVQDRFKFEQWIVEHVFSGHQTRKTGDGGIDGHIIYDIPSRSGKMRRMQAIMEVKSGKITITQIRVFCDSLAKHNADFGIFVAFGKHISDGMYEEANKMGYIDVSDLFGKIKKVQDNLIGFFLIIFNKVK